MMYVVALIYFLLMRLELWSTLSYLLLISLGVFKFLSLIKRDFEQGNDIDILLFLIPWIMTLKATGTLGYFILLPILMFYLLFQKLNVRHLQKFWFVSLTVLSSVDFFFFKDYTGLKIIQMLLLFALLVDNITLRGLKWFSLSWLLSYLSVVHHAKDRFMNGIISIDPAYLGLGTAIVFFMYYYRTFDANELYSKETLLAKVRLFGIFLLIALTTSRTIMLGVILSIVFINVKQMKLRSLLVLVTFAVVLVGTGILEDTRYSVFLDDDISLTKRTSGRLDMYLTYYSFLTKATWFEVLFGVNHSGYLVWFQDWSRVNVYTKDSSLAGDFLKIHSQYISWLVRYGLIFGSVIIAQFFWGWRRFSGNFTRAMKIVLIILAGTTLISNPLMSVVLALIYRTDVKFSR